MAKRNVDIVDVDNVEMLRTYGGKRLKTCNEERLELGELVEKYKKLYEKEVVEQSNKSRWDSRRKIHVQMKPRWGPMSRSVREFYSNLRDVKHNDPMLDKATKFAR